MKPHFSFFCVAVVTAVTVHAFESRIDRFDPAFDELVATDATVERIAEGVRWAEGPVWYQGALLLSDPPANISYRWKPGGHGLEPFLDPSGGGPTVEGFREAGSNGMMVDREGRLLICQGATRRIARYVDGTLTTVADRHEGRRFSSPNDMAVRGNGDIYFTDPPYGLNGGNKSPLKEQPVNGVYRVTAEGKVTRIIDDLTYPNGIAFSPDERVLYVNVSDGAATRVVAYDVQPDGSAANGRTFFDRSSSPAMKSGPGGFDGMKVDAKGNVWTTGPGGVLVLSPAGKLLGRIWTGVPTGNCCFGGDDGRTLFIAANNWVLRVRTRVRGG